MLIGLEAVLTVNDMKNIGLMIYNKFFRRALLQCHLSRLDAQGHSGLQRVRAASQRIAHLIDNLLSVPRLARIDICRGTVDLSALAGTIATELQETQPHRRVEFMIADGLTTYGDGCLPP